MINGRKTRLCAAIVGLYPSFGTAVDSAHRLNQKNPWKTHPNFDMMSSSPKMRKWSIAGKCGCGAIVGVDPSFSIKIDSVHCLNREKPWKTHPTCVRRIKLCEQDVENCGEREENKWWVEYFTLPHTFRADPTKFRAESERNGRNGRNLVGMRCQWESTQIWLGLRIIPTKFRPNSDHSERNGY